jgi:hypothetical protein
MDIAIRPMMAKYGIPGVSVWVSLSKVSPKCSIMAWRHSKLASLSHARHCLKSDPSSTHSRRHSPPTRKLTVIYTYQIRQKSTFRHCEGAPLTAWLFSIRAHTWQDGGSGRLHVPRRQGDAAAGICRQTERTSLSRNRATTERRGST